MHMHFVYTHTIWTLLCHGLVPNQWHDAPSLGRSYYYYDTCFTFGKSAAENICKNQPISGDNVVGIPNSETWTYITNTLITSMPTGSCLSFGQGKWIGIGASCSGTGSKTNNLLWWNGDTFNNNILSWRLNEPSANCNNEPGILLGASSKVLEDANIGSHGYAVICEKALSTSQPTTSSPTTSTPTTSIPSATPTTSSPTTSIPTTSLPTDIPTTSSPTTVMPTTSNPTSFPSSMPTANPTVTPTTSPTTATPTTSTQTIYIPTTTTSTTNDDDANGQVEESQYVTTDDNGKHIKSKDSETGVDVINYIWILVGVIVGVLFIICCLVWLSYKQGNVNKQMVMATNANFMNDDDVMDVSEASPRTTCTAIVEMNEMKLKDAPVTTGQLIINEEENEQDIEMDDMYNTNVHQDEYRNGEAVGFEQNSYITPIAPTTGGYNEIQNDPLDDLDKDEESLNKMYDKKTKSESTKGTHITTKGTHITTKGTHITTKGHTQGHL